MVTCCHMWYGLPALFLVWPSWFWAIMLTICVQKIVLDPLTGNEVLILRGGIGTHTQQGSWESSSPPTRAQPLIEHCGLGGRRICVQWGLVWAEPGCSWSPGNRFVLDDCETMVSLWNWSVDFLFFFKFDCLNGVFVGSWWEWRCF